MSSKQQGDEPNLEVISSEDSSVEDTLVTYKRWFNGLHKFSTVKADPARLE